MDVDNRKTESKTGLKRMDISMEVCFYNSLPGNNMIYHLTGCAS